MSNDEPSHDDDRAVTSEPLDTEDGREVTISQQNAGPGNQVGGGEFKNELGRSVEEAEDDQDELEREAGTDVE